VKTEGTLNGEEGTLNVEHVTLNIENGEAERKAAQGGGVNIEALMKEVDGVIRSHTDASDVALKVVRSLMLSYAVGGKEEASTWAQLRGFLVGELTRDFDRMVAFVEAGRAAA
jgi:hypothetical protein